MDRSLHNSIGSVIIMIIIRYCIHCHTYWGINVKMCQLDTQRDITHKDCEPQREECIEENEKIHFDTVVFPYINVENNGRHSYEGMDKTILIGRVLLMLSVFQN